MAFNRSLFRRRRRASGSSLSNLVLWLDGADGSTLQGDPIEVWQDKSGWGNDAFQSSGILQPVVGVWPFNANSCVYFDGSQFLNISLTPQLQVVDNFTLFAVYALDTTTSTNFLYELDGDWRLQAPCDGTNFSVVFEGADSGLVSSAGVDVCCISVVVVGGVINMYLDGVLLGTDSPLVGDGSAAIFIGGSLQGYIGELMFYNIPLDDITRSDIENSLITKWGL